MPQSDNGALGGSRIEPVVSSNTMNIHFQRQHPVQQRQHLPATFAHHFSSDGFWDEVSHAETDPPAGDPPSPGGGGNDLEARLQALQAELDGKTKALQSAREYERQAKRMEALLGTTDPEALQKLRDAEQSMKQQQEQHQQAILEAQNQVSSKYEKQLQEYQQKNQTLAQQLEQTRIKSELFQHYSAAEGIGTDFEGFLSLAQPLFHQTDSGLVVKDATGKQINIKDAEGNYRPATPKEFMQQLASGKLDDGEYTIPNKRLMQHTFAPFNKAMGAGLPSGNGLPTGKSYQEMSQAELAKHAFKS